MSIELAKFSTLLIASILLAGSLTLIYVQSNRSSAPLTTPTNTIIVYQYGYVVKHPNGSKVFVATKEYTVTPPTPPKEFKGPMIIKSVPGLNATFVLSSGVVKAGEQLWIKAVFRGEKASDVRCIFVDVINPSGVAIEKLAIMPPGPSPPHCYVSEGKLVCQPIAGTGYKQDYNVLEFRINIPSNAMPGIYIIVINVMLMSLEIPVVVT